jgi:hypothetical protein
MAHRYTYDDLRRHTIDQLRDIAHSLGPDALPGHTQMNKERLLPALCTVLGIEAHVHHEVVGLDKRPVKAELRKLKSERNAALAEHDHAKLHEIRRQMHHLKHRIHAATH